MTVILEVIQYTATALLIFAATKYSYSYVRKRKLDEVLDAKISKARKERQESVEWAKKVSESMDEETRKKIVAKSFRQLQDALQSGELTAEATLTAYLGAALSAHEKTNCIVKFLKESLEEARELDRHAQSPEYTKRPLFGIPLSVKETPGVRGHPFTFGCASLLDAPPNRDDPYFVKAARNNGAVPFVLTNTPLSLMTYTTINPTYGTTCCPANEARSSGGSSGGEGALIAAGGSILGVGSDLGGSIRLPAAFSGCTGFRPASRRQSMKHYGPTLPGRPFMWPCEGPLARSMDASAQLIRLTWQNESMNREDPYLAPLNFRDDLFEKGRKYRIGYFTSSEYVTVLPPMEKAVLKAKALLEKQGHEVVPFNPPGMDQISRLCMGVFVIDGWNGISNVINNDKLVTKEFEDFARFTQYPVWVKRLIGHAALLKGDRLTADNCFFPGTGAEVQSLIHQYYAFCSTFVEAMEAQGIDAVLNCPCGSPAPHHATPLILGVPSVMLTAMYNILDFGVGVLPVGKWTKEDERSLSSYRPKDVLEEAFLREGQDAIGLPISVQIASPIYKDEIALRVLVDLEEELNKEAKE